MTTHDEIPRPSRRVLLRRKSRETEVLVDLDLDPEESSAEIDSGIGFLDHMLTSLATHAFWRLTLLCRGDLVVDEHHSAEDCALALGEALARALKMGPAPRRFGSAYAPLDEALARAVVDLSGRAYCRADLALSGARLGDLAAENVVHFFWSLASAARMTLHVDLLAGENAHHKAEAAFKALALALREASAILPRMGGAATGAVNAASTKGSVLLEEIDEADWARLKGGLDA
ncbi:MAG: imidazoleglycerol-phosphate dehydratase [Rectinemataceae bacterium]|jgi:imidazoleglycerol-phosphate dehydratase